MLHLSEFNAESFLKSAVSRISDNATRAKVKAELSAHIEDSAERYIEIGYTDEQAREKAVEKMGSPEELSEYLGKIHSFLPVVSFKNAMTRLFYGVLFSFFFLNISGGTIGELVSLFGTVLLLAASFQMRKCGRLFKNAFFLSVVRLIIEVLSVILVKLPMSQSNLEHYMLVNTFAGAVLSAIYFGIIYWAIAQKVNDKNLKARLKTCIVFTILINAVALLSMLEIKNFNIVAVTVFILLGFYILISVLNAKTYLYINEADTGIKENSKISKAVITLVLAIAILSPFVTSYLVSTRTPEQIVYQSEKITDKYNEKIKNKLLKSGYPKEILNIMTEQEILEHQYIKKTDVTYFQGNTDREYIGVVSFLEDKRARITFYFHKSSNSKYRYTERIQLILNDYFVFTDRPNLSTLILHKENGKIIKSEPLHTEYNAGNLTVGFEHKLYKDYEQYGYYAFDVRTQYNAYKHQSRILAVNLIPKTFYHSDYDAEWFSTIEDYYSYQNNMFYEQNYSHIYIEP